MTQPGPTIVIVGGGFAGIEVAKALGRAGIHATIIDRQNHHVFQPLLYQVATAALSAADIGEPIRKILRHHRSIQVLLGEVVDLNPETRVLTLNDGETLRYDILVLATGSQPSYFGHDEWKDAAPGLKTLEDARSIRSRILLAFEHAERASDPAERQRLMTFAVIGGGPTGVELAGSIAELSRHALARDFRNIRPEKTRVLLIEAGDRLLAGFPTELSEYVQEGLTKLGVEVLVGRAVQAVEPDRIGVGSEQVPVGLTIWAAGVSASPLTLLLGVDTDRGGRVRVDRLLQVVDRPDVFALGDIASLPDADGRPLPGLAQVAKQQGIHLGKGLVGRISSGRELRPFDYRSRGNTAIVGRHAAVFESGRLRLKGWLAWMAWAFIHVYLLVGFQHRIQVSIQWLWRYLTYERGARLITFNDATPKVRHSRTPSVDLRSDAVSRDG